MTPFLSYLLSKLWAQNLQIVYQNERIEEKHKLQVLRWVPNGLNRQLDFRLHHQRVRP